MNKISVWATKPQKIELLIGGEKIAMQKDANNWWHAETAIIKHGVDYAFILDDGKPVPDPRSFWQPNGVHGYSRIFDHSFFKWEDENWVAPSLDSAIIYELHVGTFTSEGTFAGVISKLDYLVDLGVTHIELMPVNTFAGTRGWGYDGVDLYAPYEIYGGPNELKKLINACHKKGIAVILDVVYNHFGLEGNYLENFAPYCSTRYNSPWGKAINFDDFESNEVRSFFCDNAIMWLCDYHFDALRIDAIQTIIDTSATHILEQLTEKVHTLYPSQNKKIILESDLNDPRVVKSTEVGGFGVDAVWSDDFHHSLHAVLTGEQNGYYQDFGKISDLAKALTNVFVYDGCYSKFRRRNYGRSPSGLSGKQFLGYLQNHDQIGNRPLGERIAQLVSFNKIKIAAAILLISPFIPMLFQGEEWGSLTPFQYFTDYSDEKLGQEVFHGRCNDLKNFGWNLTNIPDPQALETFNRSKVEWQKIANDEHRDLLEWYKSLIFLRKKFPELNNGDLSHIYVKFDEAQKWLIIEREKILLIANFSNAKQEIPLNLTHKEKILINSNLQNIIAEEKTIMYPESVIILGK